MLSPLAHLPIFKKPDKIQLCSFILPLPLHSTAVFIFYNIGQSQVSFLPLMKNSKIYNLASSPNRSLVDKASKASESCQMLARNIFAQEKQNKWMVHGLENSKSYEVVGMNELRSYQQRMKKVSRMTRADSLSTDRAGSKASIDMKKADRDLLTKEEVIRCLPKLEKQQHPSQVPRRTKRKRQSWMTFSSQLDHFHENNKQSLIGDNKSKEFSLANLINKISQHKREWSKNFRKVNDKQKFPSLFQSINEFRAKQEAKEEIVPNEDLVNTRSNLWGDTLRKTFELTHLCKKKIATKTFYNKQSFIAKGSSKIETQKKWLENKDQAGFKFKFHPNEFPEDSKKVVVIR